MSGWKRGSLLWSYFIQIDKNSAKCNICDKIVKTKANTTNIKNHLAMSHGRKFQARTTGQSEDQRQRNENEADEVNENQSPSSSRIDQEQSSQKQLKVKDKFLNI